LREWALHRLFILALDKPKNQTARYDNYAQIGAECRLVLAAVSYSGTTKSQAAESAFFSAASKLGLSTALPDKSQLRVQALNLALERIRQLKPLAKPAVLKAICAAAESDGVVNIREVEMIRTIAESIDCPMPPLLSS
jgi:uncharacterized membrane protein YebE (DUF533 family)